MGFALHDPADDLAINTDDDVIVVQACYAGRAIQHSSEQKPLIVSLPLSPPALAALVSPDALLLQVPRTPTCEARYDPRAEQPKYESD